MLTRSASHPASGVQHLSLCQRIGVERRLERCRLVEQDDVGWQQDRALVQQLHEGMLCMAARCAKDHAPGVPGHRLAVEVHALAQRFHLELLQIGRQLPQRPGVGQYRLRLRAQEVAVPDAEQAHEQRQIDRR